MTHGAYDRLVSFGGEKSNQKGQNHFEWDSRNYIYKDYGSINLAENRYN